jgi:WD40 repeat protein
MIGRFILLRRPVVHGTLGVLLFGLMLISGVSAEAQGAAGAAPSKMWGAFYNGPGNGVDTASAVAVSPDGATVVVTGPSVGHHDGSWNGDYATVAYDATTGAERWVARYNGPGNGVDTASAVAVSSDGSTVFVTGSSPGSGTLDDYATVAYDATTGAERWVARYNGPGNGSDVAAGLAVGSDGSTVFVTGSSPGSGTLDDYATVAYDATTGAERWVARYNIGSEYAAALRLSPDGSTVFVTGSSSSVTGDDYLTVAYDAATGGERWASTFQANGYGAGVALEVSPDGGTVFVTGGTNAGPATVAYVAASGEQRWVAELTRWKKSFPTAVAVSPDGSTVFVTGASWGRGTRWNYYAVADDATTGTERWVAQYDGPGSGPDIAHAVAVSPDGATVFVTGSSLSRTTSDYATVGYDAATGAERGVLRAGQGSASALALSPDGQILFVTGAVGTDPDQDFGTLAYGLAP